MQVEIGLIGGTGVYNPQLLEDVRELKLHTPFGPPSDLVTVGELAGRTVAFIPRHSKKHTIRPTDINSRANIYALKQLGVQRILAPSAVGSLREEFKPGDVVFVDQFIDRTTKREQSFYRGPQVCHVSMAEPACPELRAVLTDVASALKVSHHKKGTYVCIEGPRFSTKAESRMFKSWGADIIGMTLVPECVLAREAEICYASIATVTDYDVWKEQLVSAGAVVKTMNENIEKVKRIIMETILKVPTVRDCSCGDALKDAVM